MSAGFGRRGAEFHAMMGARIETWRRGRRFMAAKGPRQTVEEYLAAGGTVTRCEPAYAAPVGHSMLAAVHDIAQGRNRSRKGRS